nr:hypothetical protein [Tanacetum cinerariifolium]
MVEIFAYMVGAEEVSNTNRPVYISAKGYGYGIFDAAEEEARILKNLRPSIPLINSLITQSVHYTSQDGEYRITLSNTRY